MTNRYVRPKQFHADTPVRIVHDVNDSTRDYFVRVDTAIHMVEAGLLRDIDLGPEYPLSFMYTEGHDANANQLATSIQQA